LLPIEIYFRTLFISGNAGHEGDYHQFLTELSRYLRGYLSRKLPQHLEDIEDIVQEVLLAVHNARHTWRPEDPLSAWIHGITRYKLTDFFRNHYRHDAIMVFTDSYEDIFASTRNYTDEAHARRDITHLLKELPDKQRRSIQCVKLEGLSVSETATVTGFSESVIKVSIHRGLKVLAARLREII
jgi:RNA polymerase sigma-70 factor, ECF subfamily